MSVFKATGHASFGDSVRFLMVLLVIGSLVFLASNLIAGQTFWFTPIRSQGDIVVALNIGVYSDGDCSSNASSVDWGVVEPGSVQNVSLFVRNEGTVAADLYLTTGDWSPSNASEFLTLTWDYSGQILDRFEIVLVVLTLQVSPEVRGISSFSFDIIIGATA